VKARKFADAIEQLTRAAELGAEYDVYRHLADAYAAAGQADAGQKAQTTYEQMKRQTLRRAGASR
jgi:hypothetical protein